MFKTLLQLCGAAGFVLQLHLVFLPPPTRHRRRPISCLKDKHIAGVAPGTQLLYKFERKPSDEKVLGAGYSDDITVKVESDAARLARRMCWCRCSRANARKDPQRITDMDGNPMLVVFLDTALGHFRQLAGGDPRLFEEPVQFELSPSPQPRSSRSRFPTKAPTSMAIAFRFRRSPMIHRALKCAALKTSMFSIVLSDKIPGPLRAR